MAGINSKREYNASGRAGGVLSATAGSSYGSRELHFPGRLGVIAKGLPRSYT